MLRYLTAGESHGQALVVIVEGLPAGMKVTAEDIQAELGEPTGRIVRKAVCSAVITNPLVGKRHKDLTMLELMGAEISGQLAERALAALGVEAGEVTAYGKAAIVGTAGEIEHAAALIHPRFGAPVRKVVVQ